MEGYLLGYRRWVYKRGSLRPLTFRKSWKPGINYASCEECWKSPGATCDCGFNAFFSYEDAVDYLSILSKKKHQVTGAIAGAGETRVHSSGFRSAEAQIIALLVPNGGDQKGLDRYGVPVFDSEEKFLEYTEQFQTENKRVEKIKESMIAEEENRNPFSLAQKIGWMFIFFALMAAVLSSSVFGDFPIGKSIGASIMSFAGAYFFLHAFLAYFKTKLIRAKSVDTMLWLFVCEYIFILGAFWIAFALTKIF